MTRVEKYRRYRNEISNMKFEKFSTTKEAAKEIEKIQGYRSSNKLNYEQVMIIHELFENEEKEVNFKRKKYFGLTKYEIFYYSLGLALALIFIVSLILVGIKMWG